MATAALPSARPRPRPGLILAALVLAVLGVAVALPGVITDADPLAGDPALALA
ncbi:MAG: ABC transporter permease, partial [Thermobispora bispora]|nr:ABC transporter permease [Thermobispora bispora]